MRKLLIAVYFLSLFCSGCETVHQGAKEVGKPIGATFKTLGGVSEGAADAYSDEETANPYNR